MSWGKLPAPGPTTADTPIGLALEIVDGMPMPLRVRARQRLYINQIDIRAQISSSTDQGVAGLDREGDFANADWRDVEFVDESFIPAPNPDGTFTRRRMFREARWMDQPSVFVIEQLDANGKRRALPLVVDTGLDQVRTRHDSFFARRLRAIQWTNDCVSTSDCSTADSFNEEALVELRYANGPNPSFKLAAETVALRMYWNGNDRTYTIPVEQVANPQFDYGLGVELDVLTPPLADGTYAPGTRLDVQFTLRDGSGNRLHEPGTMPTLLDYLTGNNPSGVDYWNFFERTMTYYRRKHKERQMLVSINGPMQNTGPIRDPLDLIGEIFTSPDGSVVVARPDVQGFYAAASSVPSWLTMIGVAPPDAPVSDTVSFTLPENAQPGTYKILMKVRRSYLGEEIPRSAVIEIQVGTTTRTTSQLSTGPCTSCHDGGSSLTRVGHAIDPKHRDACTTCHAPLPFEPEGPVAVRVHFVHSRSGDRFGADLDNCSSCHLDRAGIQRTSKAACMSCHKSYPQDHVDSYGPIVDMYIGGTLGDSFGQCTDSCHTNHPRSGL